MAGQRKPGSVSSGALTDHFGTKVPDDIGAAYLASVTKTMLESSNG